MLNAIMTVYKCECSSLSELTSEDYLLKRDRLVIDNDKFFTLYLNHNCYYCNDNANDYFDLLFVLQKQVKAFNNKSLSYYDEFNYYNLITSYYKEL